MLLKVETSSPDFFSATLRDFGYGLPFRPLEWIGFRLGLWNGSGSESRKTLALGLELSGPKQSVYRGDSSKKLEQRSQSNREKRSGRSIL